MSSESNYTKKCLLDLIQRCEANDSHTAALTRYVEHLVTQQEAESNELQAQVDKLEAENDYAADKCLAMEAQVDELKGQNKKLLDRIATGIGKSRINDSSEFGDAV